MMKNENIQRELLNKYNHDNRYPFNADLFKRDDMQIIEKLKNIILSCQRHTNFTLIVQDFKVIDDYNEIEQILREYELSLTKNNNKKDTQYDFVNLKDSYIRLLLVKYYANIKSKSNVFNIIIAVPRIFNDYYFKLFGNIYLALLQIVDASTYNNNTSKNKKSPVIKLRTIFSPFQISKKIFKIVNINDATEINCVSYNLYLFSKSINTIKYILAKLGLVDTFKFLGINNIIISQSANKNNDYYCFKKDDNSDIYVSVPKYLFDNNELVQSFTYVLYDAITSKCTYNEYYTNDYWLSLLGDDFKYNTVNKGLSILISLESNYDIETKSLIRLPEEEKATIYHILRWMLRSFNDIRAKDNLDLGLKRIRWAEYIASFYGMKLHKGLQRLARNTRPELDSISKAIKIDPFYLLKSITGNGRLVTYADLGNDLDSHSASKYTFKGVSGMGESDLKNVPVVFKHVHKSHLYRLDLDSSSKSDPGRSGLLVPYINIYENGMLSEFTEPNEWEKEFSSLLQEYNSLKSIKELATFKKEILNIDDTHIVINDNDIYSMSKLIKLCKFVDKDINEKSYNLEEGGIITYGYE